MGLDFRAAYRTLAATTVDLSMEDAQRASVDQPIQGRGTPPPLAGGDDPAAPGGPAPYNGAPPYGAPVVPDRGWMGPGEPSWEYGLHHNKPVPFVRGPNQMSNTIVNRAFVERVQASLQASSIPCTTCRGTGQVD